MTVDANTITWLIVGAVLLGGMAVVLDRVNFPQKPFKPKKIQTGSGDSTRDRTGAHILDVDPEEERGQ